ncbi:LysR family transcriptional regulator substrate-binding protein [Streptomyces sp. NPDC005900]|uniref:LysR family transcriptional regulator substrate-binding protein n=1 Tax=unclassified Streptomyces TaxID=2593676 RepID=UPI0033DBCE1F
MHDRARPRLAEGGDGQVGQSFGEVIDPPPGPGVPLADDGYRALLPRDHPLAGEAAVDVRDLEDDAFLVSPGGCEERVRELYRLAGARVGPVRRVRDLATLISMVQAGMGVSVLSEVSEALVPADLVLLPVEPRAARRLVLSGPRGRPWQPAVRALAESAAVRLRGSVGAYT